MHISSLLYRVFWKNDGLQQKKQLAERNVECLFCLTCGLLYDF